MGRKAVKRPPGRNYRGGESQETAKTKPFGATNPEIKEARRESKTNQVKKKARTPKVLNLPHPADRGAGTTKRGGWNLTLKRGNTKGPGGRGKSTGDGLWTMTPGDAMGKKKKIVTGRRFGNKTRKGKK